VYYYYCAERGRWVTRC